MSIAFVGPSYNLRSRTAALQRTIGMIPVPIEPGNESAGWTFKDAPGLVQEFDLGAPMRGTLNNNGRVFVVAGASLFEIFDDHSTSVLGTLSSSIGNVGIVANTTQLVIGDGEKLYVLTLSGGDLKPYDYPGKARIGYINQYVVFVERDSQQFGWTGLGDASTIDALDFASAEGSPDNLVGLIVDHRELLLLGGDSTEVWSNTTDASIFARNEGVGIEDGAASEFSVVKMDSTVYWLTSSSRGQGKVVKLAGYVPVPVSTTAIEERFAGLDLSGASAFAVEDERSKLYFLNVPGLDTTLVFDALTNQWHEWAELVQGQRAPHRATHHLFAFNKHLVGDETGKLYRLDAGVSNNAGDPLLRERITPISRTPGRDRTHPTFFDLTCDRGTGGHAAMRYSPDGGGKWSNWHTKSLGAVGVFKGPVRWQRMNAGRDIVVHVRCTDDVPFNPVQGTLE